MDNSITIYELKQELHEQDLQYLLHHQQQSICFFRFTGGNQSETDALYEKLYKLKDGQALLFVIFRFPFRFEGKKRMETAIMQYFRLKEISDAIIYFNSDGMMETIESKTSIIDANKIFDKIEAAPIRSIREMIQHTGDINIDVHDLKTFVSNKDGALFVRTFEGKTFDEPLKHFISTPYLPSDFAEGNQLIVNIGYSQDVHMDTFRQINLRLNDLFHKAEIFKLGSYAMQEQGEKLKVTIIANGIADPFECPDENITSFQRGWMMEKLNRVKMWGNSFNKKEVRTMKK
ncbi:cell division protein FtsZ [Evansella cellulosilytica]|uniref:Tubulin/FtsZ GTPase n=1 Tax=Evansella cellulosilytica (strain ATCC 21833 / DSM 2522 / FERM P-1141 / JCM 9156 / N-4) TaxID=649639 RepID=E6U0D4_EVAC2|nr:cell division protein FtsZ [Evansella cellulosilytica]ADU30250.1 Tubulin/FtsZ GTPase [Evansella cellulosilytica DSM 2522]